ncbi:hypothetical protein ACFC8N_46925 [Streptomyces sp. NPDC055966]|uniref:hypothetical protein n=1 Tax=Streptomyces sp. NPDC055966 TaxID=3345669 RepID=UPI0035DF79E7
MINTRYPDKNGKALLNVAFPPATLPPSPTLPGQQPGRLLERAVHRELAEHAHQKPTASITDTGVRRLLAGTTPAHLLSAVGHALTRLPEGPTP